SPRIDGAPHLLHHVEVVLREHARHRIALVSADAVLAGDRSASLDAVCEDLARDRFGERRLPGNAFVVADERVQIAITRVKDVADAKPRSLIELTDATQH